MIVWDGNILHSEIMHLMTLETDGVTFLHIIQNSCSLWISVEYCSFKRFYYYESNRGRLMYRV